MLQKMNYYAFYTKLLFICIKQKCNFYFHKCNILAIYFDFYVFPNSHDFGRVFATRNYLKSFGPISR